MNRKKIEKLARNYNKCALKWGYSTIDVDYANRQIIGTFTPKGDSGVKGVRGFLKDVFIGGCNASLKEDYAKIKKELNKA